VQRVQREGLRHTALHAECPVVLSRYLPGLAASWWLGGCLSRARLSAESGPSVPRWRSIRPTQCASWTRSDDARRGQRSHPLAHSPASTCRQVLSAAQLSSRQIRSSTKRGRAQTARPTSRCPLARSCATFPQHPPSPEVRFASLDASVRRHVVRTRRRIRPFNSRSVATTPQLVRSSTLAW
jgi:hypothetical protein